MVFFERIFCKSKRAFNLEQSFNILSKLKHLHRNCHFIWHLSFHLNPLHVPWHYLSDGLTVRYRGGGGEGVMRVKERFLRREHGDLILPVKPVVTQLGDPFIKQLLGLDLQARRPQLKETYLIRIRKVFFLTSCSCTLKWSRWRLTLWLCIWKTCFLLLRSRA